MNVTVLGHGSLMSGRGLAFSGALQVNDAFVVALKHCTRGFPKLFATVIGSRPTSRCSSFRSKDGAYLRRRLQMVKWKLLPLLCSSMTSLAW